MINVGSISDQTLAGIIATATHGSGIAYGVMSTQVMALTLLLADGSRITCSRTEHRDLFIASICGLGSTGLILSIQLQVEPAFRLKEMQETLSFDEFIERFDDLVYSAEHVRFWWYPPSGVVRCSYSNRTQEVFISNIKIETTSLIRIPPSPGSKKILPEIGSGLFLWDTMSINFSFFSLGIFYRYTPGFRIFFAGCQAHKQSVSTTAMSYSTWTVV